MKSLVGWRDGEELPSDLIKPDLRAAYAEKRASLAPSRPEAFAVLISGLLDFGEAFGKARVDHGQKASVIGHYVETLGDLPPDLLAEAIAAHKKAWVYPGLPTPAEIRAHVSGRLSTRLVELDRLKRAGAKAPETLPVPMTDEQRVFNLQRVAGLIAGLEFKKMEADTIEGDFTAVSRGLGTQG